MQHRNFFGWLLVPVLALSAAAQQLAPAAAPLELPQSLDQLLAAGNPSPFSGSASNAVLQPGLMDLSAGEAIDRGLRYNLGLLLSSQNSAQARAARLKSLSDLLPKIDGSLRESDNKVNLIAEGLNFKVPLPGVTFPEAVEFANSDLRVSMTEELFDLHALDNVRASGAEVEAANFSVASARETVTLAVAAAYLLVVSAESQVDAATAQLHTAEALFQLAEDREAAGLSPNIDTLRARVELLVRRQNLLDAQNNLDRQRITLRRVVGLPVHQQLRLVTRAPYRPVPQLAEAGLLEIALAARPDYLAAQRQVKAAELRLSAARAERLPSVGISGDYGAIGTHPDNAFATWTLNAGVKIPIFEGGKTESDIRQAVAVLAQQRSVRDDLKGRIEQDLADALLDLASAAQQVEVAQATLDYAQQTLTQAQDRFSAGVTNNIEVIQAEEALANANQQFIGSLYSHNIAKVLLARAVGAAEKTMREVLGEASMSPAPASPAGEPAGQAAAPPAQ